MSQLVMYPASVLKEAATATVPGSAECRKAVELLKSASSSNKRHAIGLSAPQVGVGLRVFIMDTDYLKVKCSKVFINPEVTWMSDTTDVFEEGCMSFPSSIGVMVKRPARCTVKAFDMNGTEFTVELSGMAARCCLHETDHLNGVNLIDHASKAEKKRIMKAIALALRQKVAAARGTLR